MSYHLQARNPMYCVLYPARSSDVRLRSNHATNIVLYTQMISRELAGHPAVERDYGGLGVHDVAMEGEDVGAM
jgi:hypothetical protein